MCAYNRRQLFLAVADNLVRRPGTRLKELAALYGVNGRTISAAVAEETGLTFRGWSQSLSLRHAARLLQSDATLSVGQIARLSGFSGTQAFDRAFRRAFGVCPSKARGATSPSTSGSAPHSTNVNETP